VTPAATVVRGPSVHPAPRVSVVIPAYKPTWLDEALDSVRAQTFDAWEAIVVDDGSPEPVAPRRSDDLLLVRQPNTGPGGARNRGVSLARGEYIAFLDSDDRWRPGKLARQVALHDRQPGCVVSCTDIQPFGGSRKQLPSLRERIGLDGELIPFAKLFYENCIACSSAMVRRDALARTPGMDPHRRMGEDFGLWLRLGMLGSIGYVEELLLDRRQHEDSLMQDSIRSGSMVQKREVYESFLAEHPELRREPYVRAALARVELQGGYAHLTRGEWVEARRLLLRSLTLEPRHAKTWINLARAILHVG
jgi:glycosyltransferase involved in cell wall biosynthesis